MKEHCKVFGKQKVSPFRHRVRQCDSDHIVIKGVISLVGLCVLPDYCRLISFHYRGIASFSRAIGQKIASCKEIEKNGNIKIRKKIGENKNVFNQLKFSRV